MIVLSYVVTISAVLYGDGDKTHDLSNRWVMLHLSG